MALAMLPLGAVITVVAVVAVALTAGGLAWLAATGTLSGPWLVGWALIALVAWVRIVILGIETMSSFEWRPALAALGGVALIVAAWPGWWQA